MKRLFQRVLIRVARWFFQNVAIPVIETVPGVPLVTYRHVLNEYLAMAARIDVPDEERFTMTAIIELSVRGRTTLRRLRDYLEPWLGGYTAMPDLS